MKKFKKGIRLGILSIALLFSVTISSEMLHAEAYNDFSISAIQPENQIDKSVSYFDLRVQKQQVQELQVQIRNDGDKEMIASVDVNNARTGNNGVKVYMEKAKNDKSLKYPIEEMVEIVDPEIRVPAHAQLIARVRLTVPNTEIDGVVLGGIVVKARTVEDSKEQSTSKEGVDIKNQVAYVLGLKLQMNDNVVKPNLNFMSAQAALIDYRTSVSARLQNDQAKIMDDVKITGEVYKKGSSNAISKVDFQAAEISPNTNFLVVFDWNGKKVEAGNYRMHLKAVYGSDVWEWDEEFKVTEDESTKVNEGSFFVEEDNTWMWILIGVLVTLLILALAGLLFFLWKKRKKEEEKSIKE